MFHVVTLEWKKVNLRPERYNGLIYKKLLMKPQPTLPTLLDEILEHSGIGRLSNKEFHDLTKKFHIKEVSK